jgi:hypothetical protein
LLSRLAEKSAKFSKSKVSFYKENQNRKKFFLDFSVNKFYHKFNLDFFQKTINLNCVIHIYFINNYKLVVTRNEDTLYDITRKQHVCFQGIFILPCFIYGKFYGTYSFNFFKFCRDLLIQKFNRTAMPKDNFWGSFEPG